MARCTLGFAKQNKVFTKRKPKEEHCETHPPTLTLLFHNTLNCFGRLVSGKLSTIQTLLEGLLDHWMGRSANGHLVHNNTKIHVGLPDAIQMTS